VKLTIKIELTGAELMRVDTVRTADGNEVEREVTDTQVLARLVEDTAGLLREGWTAGTIRDGNGVQVGTYLIR